MQVSGGTGITGYFEEMKRTPHQWHNYRWSCDI